MNVLRLTGSRKLKEEKQQRFLEDSQRIDDFRCDILCYLDLYYHNWFRYIENGTLIDDYDLYWIWWISGISMRQWFSYYYLQLLKKKSVDQFVAYKLENDKFTQLLFAQYNHIKVPNSLFFILDNVQQSNIISILERNLNYPFIAKAVNIDRWEWVFLMKNKQDIINLVDQYPKWWFLFQEFIKNTGDIRVVVVWDKILWSFKRYNPHDYRNNISAWWYGELFELSDYISQECIRLSKDFGFWITWIDIFYHDDDNYTLIEINEFPQYEWLEKTLGINYLENVFNYFKKL